MILNTLDSDSFLLRKIAINTITLSNNERSNVCGPLLLTRTIEKSSSNVQPFLDGLDNSSDYGRGDPWWKSWLLP